MNKVIIFGGTTEGRKLAQALAKREVLCVYCVATEYGKEPIEETGFIHIHAGRLDADGMAKLYECEQPNAIIDATHPFAEIVKTEIENSLFKYKTVPFFRLSRDEEEVDVSECTFFDSASDLALALENTTGNIFLTTGSKELSIFCQSDSLRERIIARVIPNTESIELCKANGLKGNQIVAMQGPFSKAMNVAFLRECEASVLVLKESGRSGGEAERIQAANALGIKCFVIKRPEEAAEGLSYTQVLEKLNKLFGFGDIFEHENLKEIHKPVAPGFKLEVVLAGFGMGFSSVTAEVKEAIANADYIFGAPRMIVGIETSGKKYPFYLAKDIVPAMDEIAAVCKYGKKKAVVLFSGDTGFYSGATKLKESLEALTYTSVKLFPGISSISAMSAKVGLNWQDAELLSTHGIKEEIWKPQLIQAVTTREKTFLITSGSKDVREIGDILFALEKEGRGRFNIFAGTNLYADEKILKLTAEQCSSFNEDGLCSLVIRNKNWSDKILVPGLKDEEFIRDKVPMSKEEVRALSICKLQVGKNAVVYDVGSGSGSVAVELGLLDSSIRVYAIEIKEEACNLIKKNIVKFNASNVKLIAGAAPDVLQDLPTPTHVFIGGSGGRLEEIIRHLKSYGTPIRVVVNSVTLETLGEIHNVLSNYQIENPDIVQVSVSKAKKAGDYSVMHGQNPVFIVTFTL
ncbi:MAG: precorrin-6A reductase [Pseudobutyrivibrio sp.]|nr:precorrin-6A reductase [Pseudobutyrivibrio sp.]